MKTPSGNIDDKLSQAIAESKLARIAVEQLSVHTETALAQIIGRLDDYESARQQPPQADEGSRDELLSEKQAAELLGLKRQTLSIWRVRGSPIPFCRIGAAIRYRRGELLDYIARRTATSTSEADTK